MVLEYRWLVGSKRRIVAGSVSLRTTNPSRVNAMTPYLAERPMGGAVATGEDAGVTRERRNWVPTINAAIRRRAVPATAKEKRATRKRRRGRRRGRARYVTRSPTSIRSI